MVTHLSPHDPYCNECTNIPPPRDFKVETPTELHREDALDVEGFHPTLFSYIPDRPSLRPITVQPQSMLRHIQADWGRISDPLPQNNDEIRRNATGITHLKHLPNPWLVNVSYTSSVTRRNSSRLITSVTTTSVALAGTVCRPKTPHRPPAGSSLCQRLFSTARALTRTTIS